MRGSKVRVNNLGEGLGCRGDVQRLPRRCAKVAGEMCQGCWNNKEGEYRTAQEDSMDGNKQNYEKIGGYIGT